uniref:HIG1 domain-containing protein n=1 Tax=Strongyloides venezuelensis TaxID=75913 RepID=A0A0K0FLI5_STRVS
MNSTNDGLEWQVIKEKSSGAVPKIPNDIFEDNKKNYFESKLIKVFSNPFVPAGLFATCGCLLGMLIATKNRDPLKAQYFMRGRIAAQAFTVIALVSAGLHSVNWNMSIFSKGPAKLDKPTE